jgi:hypothetical protein
MTLATREPQVVEIDRTEGGQLAPVNNGIVINWHGRGGGAASTPAEPVRVPSFLAPALICLGLGMLIAQGVGQGIGHFQNQQLAQRNSQLTQEKAQLQGTVDGVKAIVGCK